MNAKEKKQLEKLKSMMGRIEVMLKKDHKINNDTLITVNGKYVVLMRDEAGVIINVKPVPIPLEASWIMQHQADQMVDHIKNIFGLQAETINWKEALKNYTEQISTLIEMIENQSEIIIQ